MRKAPNRARPSQRAADERSAPDAVSGAALQPARRQYLDRAWRHRLVAHLHGRGAGRRRTRCASRMRASRPDRATSRWSAAPTTQSAGKSCCTTRSGTLLTHDQHTPVWDRAATGGGMELGTVGRFSRAGGEAARARTRRKAVRAPGGRRVRITSGARPARSPDRSSACGRRSPRGVEAGARRRHLGRDRRRPATSEERAFLQNHATLPVRATGTHLGHGLEPQFPANIALAATGGAARTSCFHRRTLPASSSRWRRRYARSS